MSLFPPTNWSLVSAVRGFNTVEADTALEELCRIYRPAVLAFATQALNNETEAEDLTQDFFVDFLSRGRIAQANREVGKFRTYMLSHFKFVLLDYLKRRRAAKRGGSASHVSSDELTDAEMPSSIPDASIFDVQWALSMVREAVRLLEKEESAKGGNIPFSELQGFLPGSVTAAKTYEELTAKYGVSDGALRVRVNRLRSRFKDLLNLVLADTVKSASDLEAEREALLGGIMKSLS